MPAPVPDASDTLAATLRRYRHGHGLTVRDAGRLVDGSHWVWGRWEAGVVPGPPYLKRIADLVGISIAEARILAGPDRVRRPASADECYSYGLARIRIQAGISAAAFARRMHVSASLVSRWEAGERIPARHYWPCIAAALDVAPAVVEVLFADSRAPSDTAGVPALRTLRLRRAHTQRQLADAVHVDVTTIQRWEHRGLAPLRQACQLAAALQVDLAALARPAIARPVTRMPPDSPLRRLRRGRHLSTRVVAGRVGVSTAALLAWERESARPSWAQARRLARALSVTVEVVFVATKLESPRHLDPLRWTPAQLPAIIAEVRRWQGWTQDELGALIGVSSGTVSAWEQGRQRPRRVALERLDRRLNATVGLSELVSGGPRPSSAVAGHAPSMSEPPPTAIS